MTAGSRSAPRRPEPRLVAHVRASRLAGLATDPRASGLSGGGGSSDNRRRERDPMVFRPWWPHGGPRAMEDLVGPMSQHPDRLSYHCVGVIEVDFPTASECELGERLAIHDGVGAGLIRRAAVGGHVRRGGGGARAGGGGPDGGGGGGWGGVRGRRARRAGR